MITVSADATRKISHRMFLMFCFLVPVWLINVTWQQFLVAYFIYWFLADFMQSLFLHRWAAHKLWNPPEWLQKVLTTLSAVSLVGTPISWAAWHRTHHAFTDTEKDPHSPKYKSTFYIVFMHHFHRVEIKRAIELARNQYFATVNKHQALMALAFAFILFVLLPWQWFLTMWVVPVAMFALVTNYTLNVLGHSGGVAKNRFWLWPLMFSEVLHKDHHDYPRLSYTLFDPAGQIIKLFGWDIKEQKDI
jgi:stearoyl-CoA desaturase (delta-9 desaturase)